MKKDNRVLKVIAVLVFVLILSVIGGNIVKSRKKARRIEYVRRYANDFLTAYHEKKEDLADYFQYSDPIEFSDLNELFADNFSFTITDVKEKESEYIVSVQAKNIDVGRVFDKLIETNEGFETETDILNAIEYEVNSNRGNFKDYPCEFYVVANGSSLQIVMTEELSNAMYGGFNEYLDKLIESQFEEGK